jgi:hypothetical protein
MNKNRTVRRLAILITRVEAEQYVFIYDDSDPAQVARVLRVMGRWATNPELSFTFDHAMCCSQKVRASAGGTADA